MEIAAGDPVQRCLRGYRGQQLPLEAIERRSTTPMDEMGAAGAVRGAESRDGARRWPATGHAGRPRMLPGDLVDGDPGLNRTHCQLDVVDMPVWARRWFQVVGQPGTQTSWPKSAAGIDPISLFKNKLSQTAHLYLEWLITAQHQRIGAGMVGNPLIFQSVSFRTDPTWRCGETRTVLRRYRRSRGPRLSKNSERVKPEAGGDRGLSSGF